MLTYIRNVHITGDARGHESSRNIDAKQPYVPVVKLEVNAITHECGVGEDVVQSRRNCLLKTSSIRTQSSGCAHLPIFLTQNATWRKPRENKWKVETKRRQIPLCVCVCVTHTSTSIHHSYRQRKERNRKGPKPAQIQPANSSHSTTVTLHMEQPFYFVWYHMFQFMASRQQWGHILPGEDHGDQTKWKRVWSHRANIMEISSLING